MTPETIATGWIILAAALLTIGGFIAWGIRDWWTERCARKAERIVTTPNPGSVRFEAECTRCLAIAAHTAHAVSRVAAIPEQRSPFDQAGGGRR